MNKTSNKLSLETDDFDLATGDVGGKLQNALLPKSCRNIQIIPSLGFLVQINFEITCDSDVPTGLEPA
jgi:hypothetical protein